MNKEALEKIAGWAGFTRTRLSAGHMGWLYPDGATEVGYLPDFTEPIWGIAHCFRWLVPKLDEFEFELSKSLRGKNWLCCIQNCDLDNWQRNIEVAETPALALCLAIKKLVDSEK